EIGNVLMKNSSSYSKSNVATPTNNKEIDHNKFQSLVSNIRKNSLMDDQNKKYELGQSNNGIRREMDISQVDENIRIVARLISDEKNYDFIPDFLYGQLSEEENEENQTKISADRASLHFNEIHIEDSVPLHISTIL